MKLLVVTPAAVVVDADAVTYVRAEDETGAFGILKGHADFVTALNPSVVTWRNHAGRDHHVAVRGGILAVRGGTVVEIATREAAGEDVLERLGASVLARFREDIEAEERARTSAAQLQAATIRQVLRYLDASRAPLTIGTRAPAARSLGPSSDTGSAK